MATAELHFFDADDPNGSTIFECSTDDQFVKSIELDIQRDSLGSGKVNFARKTGTGLFTRQIVAPEVLVRVLVPSVHPTKYFYGFFINPRQQQVVSKAEQGGEGFTFAGPGPKHYLERMILWSASFTGIDSAVDKEAGIWRWPETAKAGKILDRLIDEDQANPSGPFLPDLTKSFDAIDDSDGNPWTEDVSDGEGSFTLRISDDYLKQLWTVEDVSGITSQIYLGEVGDPKIRLDVWENYGRDLTADVQFVEGVNIAADLDVEGSSYRKASHALVRGTDGVYNLAFKPSWSPGDLKKVVGTSFDSNSGSVLDAAGERFLQRQDNGEEQIDLKIVTGFDPTNGLYMPGPDYIGGLGHFWVGDSISLTTGQSSQTALDYDDETEVVTGIELELAEAVRDDTDEQAARSFEVTVKLNEERKSNHTARDLAGNRGTVAPPVNILAFCRYTTPPTETGGSTVLSLSWDWETNNLDNGTSTYDLMASRANPTGPLSGMWGFNGGASTQPPISPRVPIVAGQVVRIEGDFAKQLASSTQVSSIHVRFYTAISGGSDILDVLVGIPASGSGLGVVATINETVEAPATATYFTIAPGRNLYANDVTLSVEGAFVPDDPGTTGGGLEELLGISTRAARCDHRHHVLRDTTPLPTDDGVNGYPEGTYWRVVDDVDNPTVIFSSWLSVDASTGAAVWIPTAEPAAEDVGYDNTNSGLDADTVQDAIDELDEAIDALEAEESSGIGEILISDTPSTPLVFADLLQNEAQNDLVYGDPA